LVERTTVRSPTAAIGRRLKPLDARTDPQTRFNWWLNQKKKKKRENEREKIERIPNSHGN
jgi:hypothetical protein